MSHLSPSIPLPSRPRSVRPSLQPDDSSQPPSSLQLPSSQSTSNPKRAQKLNSKKKAVLKPVFESFIAPLEEAFPAIKWDYCRVESRFTVIRDKYRVYQEMVNITGSIENKDKGRVSISWQQEADLWQLYLQIAYKIFSNNRPVGRFITEAGDNNTFAYY
ncbi:unnamed protein product [Fusarium fujikuroi]|nr:unnamed protein product [Fusarium fujikuroi]